MAGLASYQNPDGSIPTTLDSLLFNKSKKSCLEDQLSSRMLPVGYEPTALDVCSGRGKSNWHHAGNVAFRNIIQSNVQRYTDSVNKIGKTLVIASIVDDLRTAGYQFIKKNKGGIWYDIGDAEAREKVAHGLRDQVNARARGMKGKESKGAARKAAPKKRAPKKTAPPSILKNSYQGSTAPQLHRPSILAGFIADAFSDRQQVFDKVLLKESGNVFHEPDKKRKSAIAFMEDLQDFINPTENVPAGAQRRKSTRRSRRLSTIRNTRR